MARPSGSPPTLATDASYTNSPGKTWQGTPTRIEPSSGEKAQGITPGRIIPSQWLNWFMGLAGVWLAYFSQVIDADDELTYLTPKPRSRVFGVGSFRPEPGDTWNNGLASVTPTADGDQGYLTLEGIPAGCTITSVFVLWNESTARSPADTMHVTLYRVTNTVTGGSPGQAVAVIGSSSGGSGASGVQVHSWSSLGEVVSSSVDLALYVVGPTGSIGPADALLAVEVFFTDPGPRNT